MKANGSTALFAMVLAVVFSMTSGADALVINEIMYDPAGAALDEWVEIYVDVAPGDVAGYSVIDQDGRVITFPSFSPAAGEYIIVATGPGVDQVASSPYVIYGGYGAAIWANGGDDVSILDAGANCIDYMAYGAQDELPLPGCSWTCGGANPTSSDGVSLSLINNGVPTGDCTAWEESGTTVTIGPHSQGFSSNGPAAVELERFLAIPGPLQIQIEWETAAELDSEGFFLNRSMDGEEYTRITPTLIPAVGGPIWGEEYAWVDHDVIPGVTYSYVLEEIDIYGQSSLFGPVSTTALGVCGAVAAGVEGNGVLWTLMLLVPAVFMVLRRRSSR